MCVPARMGEGRIVRCRTILHPEDAAEDVAYVMDFWRRFKLAQQREDGHLNAREFGQRVQLLPERRIQRFHADLHACAPGDRLHKAAIDPEVMDRIVSSPRARDIVASPPPQPDLAELKRQHGTDDEDELILRAPVPASDLDRMRRSGPPAADFPTLSSPEPERVRQLMKVATSPFVQLRSAALDLTMRR